MYTTPKNTTALQPGEPCPGYVVSPTLEARKARIVAREGFWCPLCEGTHYIQDTSHPRVGQRCERCNAEVRRVA